MPNQRNRSAEPVKPSKPSRLFFDIETSPNIGLFWKPGRRISLSYDNILVERAVICVAWKWEGRREVEHLTWDKKHNDYSLLKKFIPILDSADEVVAHNGDHFDLAWLRGRCAFHRLPMPPNYMSVDTLYQARKNFNFNANHLDYLARFFGLGKKIHTDLDLWKGVMNNDPQSMAEMLRYCRRDVRLLEGVHGILSPYVVARSNRATHTHHCPECNSANTIVTKHRMTALGYQKIQFQCQDCGKYQTVAASRFRAKKAL